MSPGWTQPGIRIERLQSLTALHLHTCELGVTGVWVRSKCGNAECLRKEISCTATIRVTEMMCAGNQPTPSPAEDGRFSRGPRRRVDTPPPTPGPGQGQPARARRTRPAWPYSQGHPPAAQLQPGAHTPEVPGGGAVVGALRGRTARARPRDRAECEPRGASASLGEQRVVETGGSLAVIFFLTIWLLLDKGQYGDSSSYWTGKGKCGVPG